MMQFEDFPQDYQKNLKDIADYFQNTLNEQLQTDSKRYERKQLREYPMETIAFKIGEKMICIENLHSTSYPVFSATNYKVDFKNACVLLDLNMNDLSYEGNYSCENCNGKINIDLKNVKLSGRCGMFMEEDSLCPRVYDFDYVKDIKVTLHDFETEAVEQQRKEYDEILETKVLSIFWPSIENEIRNMLLRVIGENVIDFSASELLNDDPEPMRKYINKRADVANQKFDNILSEFLNKNVPRWSKINLPFEVNNGNYKLIASVDFDSLESLARKTKTSMFEAEGKTIYCAELVFNRFSFNFTNCKLTELQSGKEYSERLNIQPESIKMIMRIVESKDKTDISVKIVNICGIYLNAREKPDIWRNALETLKPQIRGYMRKYCAELMKTIEE